jgi:ADP-ribose pyrophosphatase YjhB (NUDIX family)
MNWIQKHALRVLMRHAQASLKEMKPQGVDANLFSYHIHYLKTLHIIESVARGHYQLTTKGMRTAGKLSSDTGGEADDVKTIIVLYASRGDEVLLFKWSRHPYLGYFSLPHDRYNYGESLSSALNEALNDKLKLTFVQAEPTYMKSGMIHILHNGEQVSCMSAHVYRISADSVSLPMDTRNGTPAWMKLDDIFARDDVMTSLPELIAQIRDESIRIFDIALTY